MSTDFQQATQRPFVLDVSRMIWRVWTGRLPTGIDRVCLAYLERYRDRSLALVQRGPLRLVLDARASDALFTLLLRGGKGFRRRVVAQLAAAPLRRAREPLTGKIYLNIGHTGLDTTCLPGWLRRQGLRPVFLIHDLIPITHPQFCRRGEDRRHALRMRHVLECADGVIVNSQTTRDDLAAFAAATLNPMPATTIAWLGIDRTVGAPPPIDPERPYFIVVGTIEARKNHLMLLRIWEDLAREGQGREPMLVLVGQRGWEADETFALLDGSPVLKHSVRELSRCSDAELAGLFDHARALLMPSLAEGFGLPVFEALQRGLPVIAADLAVYREVAGEIPLYLGPTDRAAWLGVIRAFTGDSAERERQRTALQSFDAPDWQTHFARVDQFLADLPL